MKAQKCISLGVRVWHSNDISNNSSKGSGCSVAGGTVHLRQTAVGVVGGQNGGVRTVDQPRSGQLHQEVERWSEVCISLFVK